MWKLLTILFLQTIIITINHNLLFPLFVGLEMLDDSPKVLYICWQKNGKYIFNTFIEILNAKISLLK